MLANGRPTRQPRARIHTARTHETFLLITNLRGELSRLPNDFHFPKGGMYDCWVQWNVGHIKHSIPPLSSLTPREFQFIDDMAKTDSEQWCQRGPHKYKDKRRPSWKIYCDMQFLCNHIESMVCEAGADTSDPSLKNVRTCLF